MHSDAGKQTHPVMVAFIEERHPVRTCGWVWSPGGFGDPDPALAAPALAALGKRAPAAAPLPESSSRAMDCAQRFWSPWAISSSTTYNLRPTSQASVCQRRFRGLGISPHNLQASHTVA